MSAPDRDIDLRALVRADALPPPRRSAARIVVPGVLLIGFLALLAWSFADHFVSRLAVRVVRPVAVADPAGTSSSPAGVGVVVVQAAGWVEPDPFPTEVAPLAEGVVEQLLVQEADVVVEGQPIATLVAADATLALRAATARAATARAAVERADAELRAARADFDAGLVVHATARRAAAHLDAAKAQHALRNEATARARAEVTVATEELAIQQELAREGAAGPRQLELATARVAVAEAEVAARSAEASAAGAQVADAEIELERARRDLDLRIAERLRIDVAVAEAARARAALDEAEAAVAEAELRSARMTVRAPIAGVVLERKVPRGAFVGPQTPVVSLYDPSRLRIRVDVPQSEIGKLAVGAAAEIRAEGVAGEPFRGTIARIVHRADIQKLTVQVHVPVTKPDARLRPEMLCQVRFSGGGASATEGAAHGAATHSAAAATFVAIPANALRDGAVFVVDPDGRVRRTSVRRVATDGDRVVVDGLDLTAKVVTEVVGADASSLRDGVAVEVVR